MHIVKYVQGKVENKTPDPISQVFYFVLKYATTPAMLPKIDKDAITFKEIVYIVAQCLSFDLVWTKEFLTWGSTKPI